ncbi:unnamed protein product [Gemmata massiliana]|uniref:Uncharacterized protein n=1 Tax=Gemmata massiliana TaxID=1210884 RepID=A0A6P2D7I8_9BACT|nr:hypothetical protein [Gemmata massiliana]VTR97301.1 unnamed protein product [Gemmata massiliana]
MSVPQVDPGKGWVRLGRPATRSVMVFGGPPADSPETPRTEMVVQVTLSAQAHPDDVAAVLDKLRAAIKEATEATEGRIDIQFALPEIVR